MNTKPKTLQQAIRHFSDEQVCIDTVAAARWPKGPICPKCDHTEHYYLSTQRRWKCKKCGRQFSVKVGTIFEDSPVGLDKWLCALWMLTNCKNGISSYEIHRALGVTQKTGWFMLHRLRLAMHNESLEKLGGPDVEIEADETFVGGKVKNMHHKVRSRRRLPTTGYGGKATVMGILERGKEVRATLIPHRGRKIMQAEIVKHVAPGSSIYTDNFMSYDKLPTHYRHDFVDHARGYVRGRVHTNGLENFWSLFKRTVKGTYVSIEPFHMQRYLDEQVFRYNNRAMPYKPTHDGQRFEKVLSQIAGKRLTYSEVTGKVGETAN
jgi:transposase-like protein